MKRPPIHITLDELSLPEGLDLDAPDLQDRLRRALEARWRERVRAGRASSSPAPSAPRTADDADDPAAALTSSIANRVWQAIEAAASFPAPSSSKRRS